LAQVDEVMKEVETLLFIADEPLVREKILEYVPSAGNDMDLVMDAVDLLNEQYAENGRAFRIVSVAGGWKLATIPSMEAIVSRFLRGGKKTRLSRQAMETLAIVAFKQPVTRAEIESIRGVDSLGVLRTLFDRELIEVRGRAATLGRPLLYGTTKNFLVYLGLNSIDDLPKPGEIGSMENVDTGESNSIAFVENPDNPDSMA